LKAGVAANMASVHWLDPLGASGVGFKRVAEMLRPPHDLVAVVFHEAHDVDGLLVVGVDEFAETPWSGAPNIKSAPKAMRGEVAATAQLPYRDRVPVASDMVKAVAQ
jgi:hypothetical protein